MFQNMASFADVRKDQYIIDNILWDTEPKDLMEPRILKTEGGVKKRAIIRGYVFYIDTTEKKPQLFLLRHTAGDYAETLARVDDIPEQMLRDAVQQNQAKEYFKMYPINDAVRVWLRKALLEG